MAGLLLFVPLAVWDRSRLAGNEGQRLRSGAVGVWILGDIGRPVRSEMVAVVVGFAGLVVLLRPGSNMVALGWVLLLVLAAVIEASGQVTSQHVAQPPDAFAATAWQLTGAGIALLLAGAAIGELGRLQPAEFTAETAVSFAFLVIPGSLVAYAAFVWLLATSPIQLVASYAYVNPVVAVALGWALVIFPSRRRQERTRQSIRDLP